MHQLILFKLSNASYEIDSFCFPLYYVPFPEPLQLVQVHYCAIPANKMPNFYFPYCSYFFIPYQLQISVNTILSSSSTTQF